MKDLYPAESEEVRLVLPNAPDSVKDGTDPVFAVVSLDKRAALEHVHALVESGQLRPIIDRRYAIEEIVDAHRYVDTGRKRGNVVITVTSP